MLNPTTGVIVSTDSNLSIAILCLPYKDSNSLFKLEINQLKGTSLLSFCFWYQVDKQRDSEEDHRLFCLWKPFLFTSFILMHKVVVKYDSDGRV